MDKQLLTLSKIFTERLFRIPDYQRGYAWTSKQLKDFWNDIQQLEPDRNHYTGVLTLESVPASTCQQWDDDFWIIESKSYQPFFIVDGQQRLTTAIILIQAILEHLPDGEKLNYTTKTDIQRKFIFDSKDDGISRSYVFGYERDNPSYEYLKTKIFCEKSSTSSAQETVYTHNLSDAKHFFAGHVVKLRRDQLETLYRKVTQHLLFNIFTITEDVDVCVAFETMNNRGKPLSYLELLKNRLIYLSLKFAAEEYEKNKLRRAINDCWKAIYHNLGRNKNRPLDDDKFLSTHYIIYFGKAMMTEPTFDDPMRYRNVYHTDYASDLLEKRFIPKNVAANASPDVRITLSDVYRYVSSLQESIETWFKMHNPLLSDLTPDTKIWLDKLNRIGMDNYHPLILAFLQRVPSEPKRLAFLQALERYLFTLTLVARYYRGLSFPFEIDPKSLELAIDLSSDKVSAEKATRTITDATHVILKDNTFIKSVLDRFRSDGFYTWYGIRYFLYEHNLDLQEKSKTERPKIFWPEFNEQKSDFISVEHVYPQQARDKYWTTRFAGLQQKQREALRNSLGNLLPLSKPKNASLSNRPFPDKVEGKGHPVGYRYGCYAENEVAKAKDWTPTEILTRGIKLLAFMEKRWDLNFGDEAQKKLILGLEFMN